ncbi:low specificity L-threonine aldolase [Rhodobacteraceae bacterium CCMM004]|nr:low specificity L-threonine aldolase [Rhodobacteraceae bacterium CCMM004]
MTFASDNTGPAHPKVMDAVAAANTGYALPYGVEAEMERVTDRIRTLLDVPRAEVRLVPTGTAANMLLLGTLADPHQQIYCTDIAHVLVDECGAVELTSGGARLTPVPHAGGKMTADALARAMATTREGDVHNHQRGPVSITNLTERGTLYRPAEVAELAAVAARHGRPLHMDGARFANAVAASGAAPSEMVRDLAALSFGGTKNGCLGVEAAVLFDPDRAWTLDLRRKRAGHLFSKHRFLSAQMAAYLDGDLWLEMAAAANAACARLAEGLRSLDGVRLMFPPEGNILYAEWPRSAHEALQRTGGGYGIEGDMDVAPDAPVAARLVCNWATEAADCDAFVVRLKAALA